MEIRTTLTDSQYREYAAYWSGIYTSGIIKSEDGRPSARFALSMAVHFLFYLLAWSLAREILDFLLMWNPDRRMADWFKIGFFIVICLSFLLSEMLKRVWLYRTVLKKLGKTKKLAIFIDETGLRYQTEDGQVYWRKEETNPAIHLNSTLVLSRGAVKSIRGIEGNVLLVCTDDLTTEQRRALAGWEGSGKRKALQKWWIFDLVFFAVLLGILSAGCQQLVKARQLRPCSFELEADPEYQTSVFLEGFEGLSFSSQGESAEEIVRDGILRLFDHIDMGMHYLGPVSCDEVEIFYEDKARIVAEVKVTVQAAESPSLYDFIGGAAEPGQDTRIQELVLVERQEDGEYLISEIGAEITIIGE